MSKPFWKHFEAAMREEPIPGIIEKKFGPFMAEMVKTPELRILIEQGLLPPDLPDRSPNHVVFCMTSLLAMMGREERGKGKRGAK